MPPVKNKLASLREMISALPKADLHNHLTLGPSLESLRKQYPQIKIGKRQSYDGLDGMLDFIHTCVNAEMTTGVDVAKYMEIAIEDSIADNVKLLEASIDINLIRYFDNSPERLFEITQDLQDRYKDLIVFRPDIGINKNTALDKAYFLGRQFIASGLFSGIDLYGPENDLRLDGFAGLFQEAKNAGLRTKVHIGEFSGPESINNAIDLLLPDDIQHGIKAAASEPTMEKILKSEIRLNICPRSNIALGSVASLAGHPIRKLFDFGINLTINTDDRLLFHSSLTDQFVDLIDSEVFTFAEIDGIRENSLKARGPRKGNSS